MHPITYSLITNSLAIAALTFLTWFFAQPWLVMAILLAIVLQTHALQRFTDDQRGSNDNGDDDAQPMGFMADIG